MVLSHRRQVEKEDGAVEASTNSPPEKVSLRERIRQYANPFPTTPDEHQY